MRVYKVNINGLGGYITEHVEMIRDDLVILRDEGGPENKVTIEIVEMTQEELDAAPEFKGF